MRKIGIRYYDTLLTEESFRDMHEGGMTATELSLVHEPENLDFKKVRELADHYEIELWSCHLPFRNCWSVVQKENDNQKKVIDLQKMLIERATDIGVDKFVMHPGSPIENASREESKKRSMETLSTLADFAASRGARIAVENMITTCLGNTADELLELVSANEKLRICFDVNHLLLDKHEEFAEKVRDKLITMHISDYDFIQERHWFPGYGKIDWVSLYKKICEIGYEGAWIYELSPGVEKEYLPRALTVRDFYNNAMEIFSGKQPRGI